VTGGRLAAGRRPPPPRARLAADRVYLGWQYAPGAADPGPAPPRPPPVPAPGHVREWAAAQRREEHLLERPARRGAVASLAIAAAAAGLAAAGQINAYLAGFAVAASAAGGVIAALSLRSGRQDLRDRLTAEESRVAALRAAARQRQAAVQGAHARQIREWRAQRAAFEREPAWFPVSLPLQIDRIDLAGGTLAGWSALVTMVAAPRLSAGGDVTIVDLTEGAVARDLLAVAHRSGIRPLVWVLPDDLPKLDLGAELGSEALADVLAMTVAASAEPGPGGAEGGSAVARDTVILRGLLGVLGEGPAGGPAQVARIAAALRALGQVADPREDLAAGLLTAGELERIGSLFGRGAAERVVVERSWAMQSRLRWLEALGRDLPELPPTRLRVVWLDRRASATGNRVLGAYLVVTLTHLLRQMPPRRKWQQTLIVLGAQGLPGEVIGRLCDACEMSGTGLVIGYRSLPAPVRERLGSGNAAVAFMRLGNAADARAASEQIGAEHRFVLSQLTDTVGSSWTDTEGGSYGSTVGLSDSVSGSTTASLTRGQSRGRGRSRQDPLAPFGNFTGSATRDTSLSWGISDASSLTEAISTSTSWGISTSHAVGTSTALARSIQRSREFLVEQQELQQLPPSAVIVSYAGAGGQRVVLADANPAIITLPTAALRSLDEARGDATTPPAAPSGQARPPQPTLSAAAAPRLSRRGGTAHGSERGR
jgi:hypothetical protein